MPVPPRGAPPSARRAALARVGRWAGELLLVALLVVLAGEAYFRLPGNRPLEYTPDPELVGVLRPGQRGGGWFGDTLSLKAPPLAVNADGHRGPDTDWSRPVVVAVGDSQAWGTGVADDQVWTACLERDLRREAGPGRIQVANASHPGHGPFHQAVRLRRALERGRPEAILVRVSIEDRLFLPDPPEQVPRLLEAARRREAMRRYSKFLPFLVNKAKAQVPRIENAMIPWFLGGRGGGDDPKSAATARRMWRGNRAWWADMARMASGRGIPLVFFVHDPTDSPAGAVLEEGLCGLAPRYPGVHVLRLGSRAYGLRPGTTEQLRQQYKAAFTFFPRDDHANARQHALVGRLIAGYLGREDLVSGAGAVAARDRSPLRPPAPAGESPRQLADGSAGAR